MRRVSCDMCVIFATESRVSSARSANGNKAACGHVGMAQDGLSSTTTSGPGVSQWLKLMLSSLPLERITIRI